MWRLTFIVTVTFPTSPILYSNPCLTTKRRSLNEKKMVHTLMSCTGGIVHDEDPGRIVESNCISVREREGRAAS